ncbi:hypothetical protein AB1N83_007806 [Pleurotus pulmonarius]
MIAHLQVSFAGLHSAVGNIIDIVRTLIFKLLELSSKENTVLPSKVISSRPCTVHLSLQPVVACPTIGSISTTWYRAADSRRLVHLLSLYWFATHELIGVLVHSSTYDGDSMISMIILDVNVMSRAMVVSPSN